MRGRSETSLSLFCPAPVVREWTGKSPAITSFFISGSIMIDEDEGENYEIALERMVFAAVKIAMKGRRHSCDPYYDDAFDGYDDGNYGE